MVEQPEGAAQRGHCNKCGVPVTTLLQTCEACLFKRYLEESLEQQRETLKLVPQGKITLARDRAQMLHMVLFGNPKMAWCGSALTQVAKKRVRVVPGKWPPDLCEHCRRAFDVTTAEIAAEV
jgi:hypothetical protein